MKIENCPFCGTPALVMYDTETTDVFGTNQIKLSAGCSTCGISFKRTIDGSGTIGDLLSVVYSLVEDWNRRA